MLIAKFKDMIQSEMSTLAEQGVKMNKIFVHLRTLGAANSIQDFFKILATIDLEARMPLVVKSPAIHTLILAQPDLFIEFFSHNDIKAIIYQLCGLGHVDLVKSLYEKMTGNINGHELVLNAFRSGSLDMVKFLLEDLKRPLYPNHELNAAQKKSLQTDLLKIVAKSGSVELLDYLEHALEMPVDEIILEELRSTQLYLPFHGDLFFINAISSYQVEFMQFLFETKALMPNKSQLNQLLGYAYDNGRSIAQHQKFVTLAYVYGFVHENARMQALLYKVAESSELRVLSPTELFALFSDFTQHFQESSHQFAYGKRFRPNSIYLGDELARRNLSKQELIHLAKHNQGQQALDILYYLVVMGKGYSDPEVIDILNDPIFDVHGRFQSGNTPLHLAILYHRRGLIKGLLEKGANPDAKNERHQTPLSLLEIQDKIHFKALLSHTIEIKNSMMDCMKIRESEHIAPLLQHMHGQAEHAEVMTWLEWSKGCLSNIYHILSNLNDNTYKQIKQTLFQANQPTFIHALAYVEHFKKTGEHPKKFIDVEQAAYHIHLVSVFGNEPCEARVVFGLALLSLETDQPYPYPAFLQSLNLKRKELTADKVAHALWLKNNDPETIKISQLSFTLWAKTASLPFDLKDVNQCLETRYRL